MRGEGPHARADRLFGNALLVLVGWSVLIKYVLPVAFALREHAPLGTHVMWDLWPALHLVLWRGFRRHAPWLPVTAIAIAVAEIVIVAVKLTAWAMAPDLGFFRVNWAINKVFVLGLFTVMLVHFASRVRRGASLAPADREAAGA
ncbi:MAG: hypothetical protein U0166_12495 [Acidobacteriota bacterium]